MLKWDIKPMNEWRESVMQRENILFVVFVDIIAIFIMIFIVVGEPWVSMAWILLIILVPVSIIYIVWAIAKRMR